MINQTYFPPWWLSNPHLQTLYPTFLRPKPKLQGYYQRERLDTEDNDFIDIDWCDKDSDRPLIILLHGLTGSSNSTYITGLQNAFYKSGWKSVVLNFRGCSGELNNLARGYHSGDTGDINFVYQTLRQREPKTPIAVVGFSLGGNVLLKWLGEQGNQISLVAAVAVSVPLQLDICANKLDQGFSKLYRKHLISNLIIYMENKQQHLESKGLYDEALKISELGSLKGIKSFWAYDDRVVAKLHNFKDVHEYYKLSSSRQFLKSIQIPTIIIQAEDDPFMTKEVLPDQSELSPSVELLLTKYGGHVGFITANNIFKPEYWLESYIPEFLRQQGFQ
jgi:predicted alpha/beta-fold hydrolase